MITTELAIDCLLEKALITEDQANEMKQILSSLPADPSVLLQLLVAITLTQEA